MQQILSWLSSWFPNDKIDANLSEVLLQFITLIAQNIADVLMKLYLFHGLSNLDTVKGLTSFSFWVAANIPVDTVIRLALLEESCTDRRIINECLHLRKVFFFKTFLCFHFYILRLLLKFLSFRLIESFAKGVVHFSAVCRT